MQNKIFKKSILEKHSRKLFKQMFKADNPTKCSVCTTQQQGKIEQKFQRVREWWSKCICFHRLFGGRRKQNEEPSNVRVAKKILRARKNECSSLVFEENSVVQEKLCCQEKRCSKMTQVTNRKVLGEAKKEKKNKIGRMRNNSRCLTAVRAIGASIQKKGI